MNALLLLLLAQAPTSSTATLAAEPTVPPPISEPAPIAEPDPLADLVPYVGTPLLLPEPPPPKPPPPEPVVEVPPKLALPPPVVETPPPPPPPEAKPETPWFYKESRWLEQLRSAGGIGMVASIILLMVLAAMLSSFVRKQNDRSSLLSRLASSSNKLLRIFIAMLLLLLAVAWLPPEALPFALLAFALAVGWSVRDVVPDLIAGAVLSFERRVRPGMWLSGDGFAGVVERVGLRATWLRDATDRRVAVPNRTLVSNPVTSDDGRWPTREVHLRIAAEVPADAVRRAIVDAVLASPWTPVSENPSVERDGADPSMWHVRARVLDLSFAGRFEGELLERAEAMLSQERRHGSVR